MIDFLQQPVPSQVEADLQILAEVLPRADAGQEAVFVDLGLEEAEIEVGVPALLAVGAKIGIVAASQRGERVDIDRVSAEEAPVILAHRARAKETAAGMVAFYLDPIQQAVGDGHAR